MYIVIFGLLKLNPEISVIRYDLLGLSFKALGYRDECMLDVSNYIVHGCSWGEHQPYTYIYIHIHIYIYIYTYTHPRVNWDNFWESTLCVISDWKDPGLHRRLEPIPPCGWSFSDLAARRFSGSPWMASLVLSFLVVRLEHIIISKRWSFFWKIERGELCNMIFHHIWPMKKVMTHFEFFVFEDGYHTACMASKWLGAEGFKWMKWDSVPKILFWSTLPSWITMSGWFMPKTSKKCLI